MTPPDHDHQPGCPDARLDTRLPVPAEETSDGGEAEAPDLSPDALFDVLATTRTRYVLYHLVGCGGTTAVDRVATAVTSWETGTPVDRISEDERERTAISLLHETLPKLDDYGFVEYDAEDRVVTPTPRADGLAPFLEIARELDDPETGDELLEG